MNLWPVEHFFRHFLTAHTANQSKSEEKSGQRFICTEVTSYKIHMLVQFWSAFEIILGLY